jgi:hypothetical protein
MSTSMHRPQLGIPVQVQRVKPCANVVPRHCKQSRLSPLAQRQIRHRLHFCARRLGRQTGVKDLYYPLAIFFAQIYVSAAFDKLTKHCIRMQWDQSPAGIFATPDRDEHFAPRKRAVYPRPLFFPPKALAEAASLGYPARERVYIGSRV